MKKILLFDDCNPIARALALYMQKRNYQVDVYSDGVNGFSINNFIDNSELYLRKVNKNYDAMILAPMYFEYDFDKNILDIFDARIFDKMIKYNLQFPYILMSYCHNFIKEGGTVVNLLSTDYMWGSYISKLYSATMSAKTSMIKSFANSLGEKRIRVNGVGAGWVEEIISDTNYCEELKAIMVKNTPLKKMAKVKEIVYVIMYLISNNASYINGQIINVDGGYSCVDEVTMLEADVRK